MTSTDRVDISLQEKQPPQAVDEAPEGNPIGLPELSESAGDPNGSLAIPASEQGCGCKSGPVDLPPAFVYAVGIIEPRFSSLGIEKEFLQAVKQGETADLTDGQVFHQILEQEENRYLARNSCFLFKVEGIETYLLQPKAEEDRIQLIEATRPGSGNQRNVVIGTLGHIAPPEACNGLQLPVVYYDRIYSFEIDDFVNTVPRPKGVDKKAFRESARELFFRFMQIGDNAGQEDGHRAINYVALRYPAVYAKSVAMHAADKSLTEVETRISSLSGSRKILDVIFSYTDRNTDVAEKFFTRVDVTEEWIFLVSKLQPYFDRSH